ncbi:Ion transport protein-domain-containing protein [Limtongia smithiae]|uniref:Ion transport protein-domain-containing protein n=1 Tax=Limtongia smithiae TaxID=1125753 RepID=UPI0034CFE902
MARRHPQQGARSNDLFSDESGIDLTDLRRDYDDDWQWPGDDRSPTPQGHATGTDDREPGNESFTNTQPNVVPLDQTPIRKPTLGGLTRPRRAVISPRGEDSESLLTSAQAISGREPLYDSYYASSPSRRSSMDSLKLYGDDLGAVESVRATSIPVTLPGAVSAIERTWLMSKVHYGSDVILSLIRRLASEDRDINAIRLGAPTDRPVMVMERQPTLFGNSLGYFGPQSRVRVLLYRIYSSPYFDSFKFFFLLVQTVFTAVRATKDREQFTRWGSSYIDFIMLIVFVYYTFEFVVDVIVRGFLLFPGTYTVQDIYSMIFYNPRIARARNFFTSNPDENSQSNAQDEDMKAARQLPYLRSTWGKVGFVSLVCYWIYFLLAISNYDSSLSAISTLRALCSLRLLRWLKLTPGSEETWYTIKRATPQLVNASLFISVFWILFAIIGIQAFNGSLRRRCVWRDSRGDVIYEDLFQFCGGYLLDNGTTVPPLDPATNTMEQFPPKGYTCPVSSRCEVRESNPYNSTVSFDNLFYSLEAVFVVMGMNGFSDLMYYTVDSDYFISSLFYIFGIIVLSWWLFNLLIAVVTASSSSETTQERKNQSKNKRRQSAMRNRISNGVANILLIYEASLFILIFANFIVACTKTVDMSQTHETIINIFETVTSIMLLVEIFVRFAVTLPRYRDFFTLINFWDLLLAVVTCIILLPPIKNSAVAYPWLSFFQIVRIYRVVIEIPWIKDSWMRVIGGVRELEGVSVFIIVIMFLVALFGSELLRGTIPKDEFTVTFYTLGNSFSGIYQIMTTENWTSILFGLTGVLHDASLGRISAIFLCLWFLFANGVTNNLFIAAIQNNFEPSEEEKWELQVEAFANKFEPSEIGESARKQDQLDPNFSHALKDFLGDSFSGPIATERPLDERFLTERVSISDETSVATRRNWFVNQFTGNPFLNPRFLKLPKYKAPATSSDNGSEYASLELIGQEKEYIAKIVNKKNRLKDLKSDYVRQNPRFNRVLFCLSPGNKLRFYCQKLVTPPFGTRYQGQYVDKTASRIFHAFIVVMVIAMVVIAAVATPFYEKTYHDQRDCIAGNGSCSLWTWMMYTDLIFAVIFSIEALIKIVADGFIFTPNPYMRSIWNVIDLFVLITMWVDLAFSIINQGISIRLLRAFKALRALRLLQIHDRAKAPFHNMIISGIGNIFAASTVAMTLLVPFSLWGLTIFAGKLDTCTDSNIEGSLTQCKGEFSDAPLQWDLWLPRSYDNPGYSFDNFGQSISILFQIISLEGWTDVLESTQDVTGTGLNPQVDHSWYNGIFVWGFVFISIGLITTLFIGAVIQNYTMKTGSGYLTTKQRSFKEMQNILSTVKPSRTGRKPAQSPWRLKCYNSAVKRRSKLNRVLSTNLIITAIVLCTEYYPSPAALEDARNALYVLSSLILTIYMIIRLCGLEWTGVDRQDFGGRVRRHQYDLGWFAVCICSLFFCVYTVTEMSSSLSTVKRLLLAIITLLLIPKNDRVNQLFIAARASLPSIAYLLFNWLVLFVVYAIAFNQIFGLTRIGENGSHSVNFRTMLTSMLLLFRMSCGEGWNSIMYDYAIQTPFCVETTDFYTSDCGSKAYAYALFMSWNVISMYIFMNMFITLVYDSFSYVYNKSEYMQFISRDVIRSYKDVWDDFDEQGNGYIRPDQLARFLNRLRGPLAVSIYDREASYNELHARLQSEMHKLGNAHALNASAQLISSLTTHIDKQESSQKRKNYEQLYGEIMNSKTRDGIPFHVPLKAIPYFNIKNANANAGSDSVVTLEAFVIRNDSLGMIRKSQRSRQVASWLRGGQTRKKYEEGLLDERDDMAETEIGY